MQINELPTIPQAPADADVMAIEVNGVTYKVNKQALAAAIVANITPVTIGAKATQSAVPDPTASGTSVTFIDSISQNAQGVISPSKKTVQSASQSASGLLSAADKTKLDGIAAGAQVNTITGVKGDSENTYRTGDVNLTPANIGALATANVYNGLDKTDSGFALDARQGKALNDAKVNKAGDTMTGTYKLQHAGVDVSEVDNGVSSTVWFSPIQLVDKDNDAFGLFGSAIYANGNVQSRISTTNGGQSESFAVGVHKDGTPFYDISTPSAFRSAAGVPAMSGGYTGNIDNLFESGIYYLNGASGTTGAAAAQGKLWGMLIVACSANRAVQLHIDIFTDVAEFRRNNGSWQAWKQFTLT